jgi:hypothetical protein
MTFLIYLLVALARFQIASATLSAAAGKIDITPNLAHDSVYMAGFGAKGRKPTGIHDPLYAHVVVVSDGKTNVALVSVDLLGLYRNDVEELRKLAGYDGKEHFLFLAATHEHSGPDTLGLWGPALGLSGVDSGYLARVKTGVADLIKRLSLELEPVSVTAGEGVLDPRGLCRDSRDPVVINPFLSAIALKRRSGKSLATIINWSCHPEVLGKDNRLITADYPGPLCSQIEKKTGGACVYFSGTIGGLLTPDVKPGAESFAEAERIGTTVANSALNLLVHAKSGGAAGLSYRTRSILIPVENSRYLLFLSKLTFGHRLLDKNGKDLRKDAASWLTMRHMLHMLRPDSRPWVESEISRVDIGPARILGIPGEAFPELAVGGYDGRYRFDYPLISSGNPNPPKLEKAPKGPYWRDMIKSPVRLIVGLAGDEIGYIVPGYDFKVSPGLTMMPRLPGHHYEETNSIGPAATAIVSAAVADILK